MKLLLDEMYPASIAEELRARGYDVVAVHEMADLRGLDDRELFGVAQEMTRAVVTENVRHYAPLAADADSKGSPHHGLVFTSNRSFPRHRQGFIGALVRALDGFLGEHPEEGVAVGMWWLEAPP